MSEQPPIDPAVITAFETLSAVVRMAIGHSSAAKAAMVEAGFSAEAADRVAAELMSAMLTVVIK